MMTQINASDDLYTQLKAQLGEEFLKSPKGKDLLKQLQVSLPPSRSTIRQEHISLIGKPMWNIVLTDLSGKPVELETIHSQFILLNIFSINADTSGPKLQRLEKLFKNYDVSQLQVVGISTEDSVKEIETFKEKHRLSMPVWIGKNTEIQVFTNSGSSSQPELITLLLNQDLVVKDMFIDIDPEVLSQKVNQAIESKE